MDIRVPVRLRNLVIIDFRKPVIRRNRPGIAKDQPSDRIRYRGIFFYPPVLYLYIAVHHVFIIEDRGFHIAHLLPLFAIKDKCFCRLRVPRLFQHLFHAVLNVFHMDSPIPYFALEFRRYTQRQ